MGLASLCVLMLALVLGMVQTLPALLPSMVTTVQYSCFVNEEAVSGIQIRELGFILYTLDCHLIREAPPS